MPLELFLTPSIWKWSIHPVIWSKIWLGASSWLGSAWWQQLCINLKLGPQPLLIGVYSNQGLWCYPWMRQPKGEVWGFKEDCCRWWFKKVFSGRSLTTTSKEWRADKISQEEYWRVRMECLRSSWGGPELHLSSFECQSIYHPQKATTPAFI